MKNEAEFVPVVYFTVGCIGPSIHCLTSGSTMRIITWNVVSIRREFAHLQNRAETISCRMH